MTEEVIHDVRLPDEIEVGAKIGPAFLTQVTSIFSGAEQRNQAWERSRMIADVAYGIQTPENYADVLAFFYERRGRAFGFRFRDWSDGSPLNPVADEEIATGDGVQRVFHLTKSYGTTGTPYIRYITHPDWDTVVVKVAGVENTDWAQGDKGTIVFPEGLEPTGSITWSGEFDVPVRFDVDQFALTLESLAAGTTDALNLIEVRIDPNTPPIGVGFANLVVNPNTSATASLPEHTSARTRLADLVAIDDGIGDILYTLSAFSGHTADLALFEVDNDSSPPALYLVAGASPVYPGSNPLKVTVNVHDTTVGSDPAASSDFTLAITNVVEAPTVTFSSDTHNVALSTDTTSHVLISNIIVSSECVYVLSLTGADAADFEIVGSAGSEQLFLKSGVDTSVAMHKAVNVHADNTAAVPVGEGAGGTVTTNFSFTIGLVAGEQIWEDPGDYTLEVPVYNTLEIDVSSPGCGTWGYTIGSTTAPTAPTQTYVQNDQGVTALERWRVEPLIPTDNPDAFTPVATTATAKQNSYGIGASLDTSSGGAAGAIGYAPAINAYPGRNLAAGAGGDAGYYDAGTAAGGAGADVTTPNPAGSIATATADGNDGASPSAGAGGGIFKMTNNVIRFTITTVPTHTTSDAGMAGGAAGLFCKKLWSYGSAQSGSGADYVASAPVTGDILSIKIGTHGLGGAGTVTGGDGGKARVRIKWS